jgi:transcriptional regulator with XRE-family HTH domain
MASELTTKLGKRVKSLRLEKGKTQEAVADASGLHVTYIASVESGKRNPSFLSLIALARGVDVTVDTLVKGLDLENE